MKSWSWRKLKPHLLEVGNLTYREAVRTVWTHAARKSQISRLMFFPCLNRKQLPSIRNYEPLPTSAILATTQAKKEGILSRLMTRPFATTILWWWSSHSLSGNHSAWPRLEGSIPGQRRALGPARSERAWRFLTLWNGPHPVSITQVWREPTSHNL